MVRVARHASGLAANPFESALRAIAIEVGITGFRPQLEIADEGFYAVVDLGDPAGSPGNTSCSTNHGWVR